MLFSCSNFITKHFLLIWSISVLLRLNGPTSLDSNIRISSPRLRKKKTWILKSKSIKSLLKLQNWITVFLHHAWLHQMIAMSSHPWLSTFLLVQKGSKKWRREEILLKFYCLKFLLVLKVLFSILWIMIAFFYVLRCTIIVNLYF